MRTQEEIITYCQTFHEAYLDYPFDDVLPVMRVRKNNKIFVFLIQREGHVWVNVKCDPEWTGFWRDMYPAVVPGYHMNKMHWNSIILDGTVPPEQIKKMIDESYNLVLQQKK